MLNWLSNLWKKPTKTTEIEKISEVMAYEEEALKRLKRIAALRDELEEPFMEEVEERPQKSQKKGQGPGIIHGVTIRGHGKF